MHKHTASVRPAEACLETEAFRPRRPIKPTTHAKIRVHRPVVVVVVGEEVWYYLLWWKARVGNGEKDIL